MKSLTKKLSSSFFVILLSLSIFAISSTNSSNSEKTNECVIGQPQNC